MAQFNVKSLAMTVFFGMLLIGIAGIAGAQEALPKGGDSFETAIELESGNYEGGAMKKGEAEYFYVNVRPGQDIEIKGEITPDGAGEGGLILYDEDRKQLVEEGAIVEKQPEQFTASWLSNSNKDSYKYYLKRYCNWIKIGSLSFELSLIDRYDAGTQTDAGDTAEKAIEIASGEYKAYLSGKAGADTKDFYKVAVRKGKTLTVKVTPPNEATMAIVVYDSNRAVLKSEQASNPGAIITNSLLVAKSGNIFVSIVCDRYCSKNLIAYTLDITTEGEAVEDENENMFVGTETGVSEGKTDNGLSWCWIIGIIALIVILAIVIYFILKKRKKRQQ